MKLTPLLISMLIFLMSGVMYLFSTHNAQAQVPQTKRSEQDSFLKNIRAKKKNNDLQRARQQKGKSDSSNEWNIRIRHQSGNYNEEEGENRSDYKKDVTDVKIWSLIIGRFGLSQLEQNFYSIKDSPDNSNAYLYERYHTESIILSYTFGDKITLSLGTTVYIDGNNYIGEEFVNDSDQNRSYYYESKELESTYSNFDHYIDTITLGFKLYGIEFLIGTGAQDFRFKDFKCNFDSCPKTVDEISDSKSIDHHWIDFGIGIVF